MWVSLEEYVDLYNKGEIVSSGDFVIKMLEKKNWRKKGNGNSNF